jgi:serine/threonine protein kinase/Tfp pilus assembly protein PilF
MAATRTTGTPECVGSPTASGRSQSREVWRLIRETPPDAPFDAERILAEHPDWAGDTSLVLDLAYEEYCRRTEAGESVDVPAFVKRFAQHQAALLRQLATHQWAMRYPQLDVPIRWPLPGEAVLGFRLLEELGRGAFSRVFLAGEKALGDRKVVVKVSHIEGVEPRVLGLMRHPHIVPVYSVQKDPRTGLSAICMPYLGRATLQDLLDHAFPAGRPAAKEAALDEVLRRAEREDATSDVLSDGGSPTRRRRSYVDAVLQLTVELAEALEHAHGQNVFHCDIKPSNVLLTRSGAKLFDFNLALAGEARHGLGGTLPYMAPEQLRVVSGEDSRPRIDGRMDLFSLGVVFHQLVRGELPWGSVPKNLPSQGIAVEMLRRQRSGPGSLRDAAVSLNPSLIRLVEKCLAYEVTDRPATARELAALLRSELRLSRRGGRFVRRHRRGALATLGLGCLATCAGGYAWAVTPPSWVRGERRGREAFVREEYEAAARHFAAVLGMQPDNSAVRFLRGRSYMLLGRYPVAQTDFEALNDALASNPYVTACLGECYARKLNAVRSDFGMAAAFFEVALRTFPQDSAMCNNFGYCQLRLGQYRLARQWLQRAVASNRTDATSHYNLAFVAAQQANAARTVSPADLVEAYGHTQHAISLDSSVAAFHLLSADILAAQVLRGHQDLASSLALAQRHFASARELGCPTEILERAAASWKDLTGEFSTKVAASSPQFRAPPMDIPHLLDSLRDVNVASTSLFD